LTFRAIEKSLRIVKRLEPNEAEAKVSNSRENQKYMKCEGKYHVVCIPKYQRNVTYESMRWRDQLKMFE
jgi:hypothetical protein